MAQVGQRWSPIKAGVLDLGFWDAGGADVLVVVPSERNTEIADFAGLDVLDSELFDLVIG